MEIFTNTKIWKKIAISLVCIILFQFSFVKPVRAANDGIGGKLMEPIMDLVVFLGDRNSIYIAYFFNGTR